MEERELRSILIIQSELSSTKIETAATRKEFFTSYCPYTPYPFTNA
ncbi:hypothetical protein IQ235_03800 [Oscillatoriales cyanobacterium LEGE 11467]|uniref:Uncharacterized protein n=1 Tax=Zarconia navalis LEGE 11467 TaxID=1828826 RepID=A0A928VYB6_9CYAN|nr:hypothetical protein [Zarconia navalis]MBE9039915.1 hypothetical protein [Zarconia navalis LEGE 11467]